MMPWSREAREAFRAAIIGPQRPAKSPAPGLCPDWLLRAALRVPETPPLPQLPREWPAPCGPPGADDGRERRPPAPVPSGPFRLPWGLPDGSRPFCHPANYDHADRTVFGPGGPLRRTDNAARARKRAARRKWAAELREAG